jgi:hypothetical protein
LGHSRANEHRDGSTNNAIVDAAEAPIEISLVKHRPRMSFDSGIEFDISLGATAGEFCLYLLSLRQF